jgi:hypothetical protein
MNGETTGYYDKAYDKLITDDKLRPLFIFHESYKSLMNHFKQYLPDATKDGLQSNFLPYVHKSLFEVYQ